jgi:hypothetical protein
MEAQRKGRYRPPTDYTSRYGSVATGVGNSRELRRADQNFSVGGGAAPNNPGNADRQFLGVQAQNAQVLSNSYGDFRRQLPPLNAGEVPMPMPARYAMAQGPPQEAVNTLAQFPTTQLSMGLPPGGGPVTKPPPPAVTDPGNSATVQRHRGGGAALGMGPSVPDAPQALMQVAAPFQQMLAQYGTLVPGVMPPKPPGMV